MAEAKVPLHLRDYCAHLYIPLEKCRKDNYYLPWKCHKEKHDWEHCEYEEYVPIHKQSLDMPSLISSRLVGRITHIVLTVKIQCTLEISFVDAAS